MPFVLTYRGGKSTTDIPLVQESSTPEVPPGNDEKGSVRRKAPVVSFLDGKKAIVEFSVTTHIEKEDAAIVVVTCGSADKARDSLDGKVVSFLIAELEKITLAEARENRSKIEQHLVESLTPFFKKVGLTLDHFSLLEFKKIK